MKKLLLFFPLLAVLFFVLACNWQMPSEIQIKGSPSLKFSLNMDFGEMFKEMMGGAFDTADNTVVIQNCVNAPEYMTFLIRVDLCNKKIDLSGIPDIGKPSITLSSDSNLVTSKTKLPVNNFNNNLEGFKFDTDKIKSSLFVDGSPIVEKLKLKISLGPNNIEIDGFTNQRTSGIDLKSRTYNGTEIPAGGKDFSNIVKPFLGNNEEMEINLSIDLKSGTIDASYLRDPEVKVELVIWLPLVFKAGDAAEIKLPGFDGMGSFLNSLTASGMIEYLKLDIGLNENPFKEGNFVIQNPVNGDKIISLRMSTNAIGFELTEEKVKYFNDNTFTPEFKISFQNGAALGIPKALKLMNVSMDARINHTIEL